MLRRFIAVLALLVCSLQFASAQTATFPVQILESAKDRTGQQLAFAIREAIRRSASMRLDESDQPRLLLSFSSFALEDQVDNATVYGVVWLFSGTKDQWRPYYLDSSVGLAGATRIDEVARTIVARTERNLTAIGAFNTRR